MALSIKAVFFIRAFMGMATQSGGVYRYGRESDRSSERLALIASVKCRCRIF